MTYMTNESFLLSQGRSLDFALRTGPVLTNSKNNRDPEYAVASWKKFVRNEKKIFCFSENNGKFYRVIVVQF